MRVGTWPCRRFEGLVDNPGLHGPLGGPTAHDRSSSRHLCEGMPAACHGLLEDFVKCLRETDCYKVPSGCRASTACYQGVHPDHASNAQVEKRSIKDCAKEIQSCEALRYSLYACRRGQLDARTRIAGNKGY